MSLTLLSPWLLLAGLAIVVPVLIHLLQRRREVVLAYPMVRFILLARKRSARRLKLRRIFLLLLRSAAVLLLTAILARPVLLTADASLTAGRKGRTVIIIDNSLSMSASPGGGPAHSEVVAEILSEYVASAAPGARFALLPAVADSESPSPDWVRAEDVPDLGAAIEIRNAAGDFNRAFTAAHRLLKDTSAEEERITVFTDLAYGSWTGFGYRHMEGADLGVPVEIYRIGPTAESAGVTSLKIRGEHRVAGGTLTVEAEILNEGRKEDLTVDLFIDEKKVDRQVVAVARGESGRVVFSPPDLGDGSYSVRVRLGEDDYRADDNRLAGLALSPPVRVLLVDGEPGRSLIASETFFLNEALNPAVPFGGEPIEAVVMSREEAARSDLGAFDVLVLANVVPRGDLDLAAFLLRGGGVAVFWGDRCRRDDYALHLPSLLPGEVTGVDESPGGAFRIGYLDRESEIYSPGHSPEMETFATASFRKRASVKAGPGSAVLSSFQDGGPWLITAPVGEGTAALVTSTADIAWNDLPTKPAFVPFVRRLVLSLAGRLGAGAAGEVTAGSEMIFSGSSGDAFKDMVVTDPAGKTSRVEFRPDEDETRAVYAATDLTGIYRFRSESTGGVFAVNPPAVESLGRPMNDKEVESRFQKVPLQVIDVDGRKVVPGYSQKGADSLTRPLFIALICLLVVEMIVAGPRKRILPFLKKSSTA